MSLPSLIPTPSTNRKWFYGWAIVAICFVISFVVFGVRLSFSVFFVALIEEFGWSRADTASIFSISMIVFASTSTLAGLSLDRFGARWVVGVGAAFLGLGLVLSSQIQSIWQLAAAYGGVASLGITILGLGPLSSLISRWFYKRRGLAIGIAFAGTGVGSLMVTPGVEFLVRTLDWRQAYLVLAGFALALIPLTRWLHSSPEEIGLAPDGDLQNHNSSGQERWLLGKAVRTTSFWLVILAALGAIGPVRMLTVHQIAMFVDAGYDRAFAALVVGSAGAVTAFAFIILGALSDRIDRRLVYLLGSAALIAAMLIVHNLRSIGVGFQWIGFYIVLLGVGEGSRSSLVTAMASDLFPGNALGGINGAVGAAFGLGAAFFPWVAGYLFDLQGSYTTGLAIAGGAVVISTISLGLTSNSKLRENYGEPN